MVDTLCFRWVLQLAFKHAFLPWFHHGEWRQIASNCSKLDVTIRRGHETISVTFLEDCVWLTNYASNFKLFVNRTNNEKDGGTHKPIRWGELVLNQIKQKNRVLKNFLFQGSYHKLLLKPIFNQSPLTKNHFVKVLTQKDIFFKLQQIDQEYNEKER